MTCNHGCRRCETEKSLQTIAVMLVCAVAIGAVVKWWYIGLPILAVLTACLLWDKRGALKSADRS